MEKETKRVVVQVDCNEPAFMIEMLRKHGLEVDVQRLEIGDYIIDGVIIERKEMSDFFSSLRDGRLWKQLFNIHMACDKDGFRGVLVAIGSFPTFNYALRKKLTREQYITNVKTFSSIEGTAIVSFGVPIIHKPSDTDFVNFIKSIVKAVSKKGAGKRPVLTKKEYRSINEIKSDMLCCIPGIGRDTGDYLSNRWTIEELCTIPIKDLETVMSGKRKLGKRAELLRDVLTKKSNKK